jgi:site-specific DNA-adenine methylase
MKNHFWYGYSGNKRNEVKQLYENIKDQIKDVDIIIEPFCGTCAMSYYISTLHPKKYTYILNDNNKFLIELYDIARSETELKKLTDKLNDMIKDIDKDKYAEIIKVNELPNYLIKNSIYCIRPGLYPIKARKTPKIYNLELAPIVKFFRNETVITLNCDAIKIMELNKNDPSVFMFLDPPYMNSCNDMYLDAKVNIYEYLYNNPIDKNTTKIMLCLESNWIIKLLFGAMIKETYNKIYEMSKKKTSHIIINNW